jgi:hypothetical protein
MNLMRIGRRKLVLREIGMLKGMIIVKLSTVGRSFLMIGFRLVFGMGAIWVYGAGNIWVVIYRLLEASVSISGRSLAMGITMFIYALLST